jgi:predicted aldo/keto reductase-like oxidoreductase
LEVAREFQRDGRCKFIGFSTHGTCEVIERAITSDEFDYVNLHWYFVNDLNWPAVEAAARRDMGVFIISPSDKGGKLYEPPAKLTELCKPLSPMAFNDLYCLTRPEVHTLSLGAAKPEDFDEHIAALDYYDRAEEVVGPIEARLREEMQRVLGHDWVSGWSTELPTYDRIPGEVNVQEILRLWTYARSLDLIAWGQMRYNLMGNAGHWFPGKNAAEFDETALRAALNGYPFADRVPAILREAHALLFDEPKQRLGKG